MSTEKLPRECSGPYPVPSTTKTINDLLSSLQYNTGTSTSVKASFFSAPVLKDFKQLVSPTTFNCKTVGLNMKQLWALCFHHDNKFYLRYREKRDEKEVVIPPWDFQEGCSCGSRMASCTVLVDMPRETIRTPLMDAQRFAYSVSETVSEGRKVPCKYLVIQSSVQTAEVMGGTSFRCEVLMEIKCITAPGPHKGCSLEDSDEEQIIISIYGGVKKMSAGFYTVKMFVIPRAMSELKQGNTSLITMLKEEINGDGTSGIASPAKSREVSISDIEPKGLSPQASTTKSIMPNIPKSHGNGNSPIAFAMSLSIQLAVFLIILLLLWSSYNNHNILDGLRRATLLRNKREYRVAGHMSDANDIHGPGRDRRGMSGGDGIDSTAGSPIASKTALSIDDRITPWAVVVIQEVDSLRSNLSLTCWVVGIQVVLGLITVAARFLL
eukprot:Tbor_TRINITY_DN4341_c0_g1::TRINITY_DN4341_c0_g1_i1::g.7787::m.7787